VENQGDISEVQLDHELLDEANLIEYPVFDVRMIGLPEANEVGRDTAAKLLDMGDDVSPAIRRVWIAV
jgi:hypothetical protein